MRDYEGIRDRYRNEQEDTVTRRTAGRAQGLAYWLIARNGHGRIEVLTLDGKKTLPVFSYEGEAEMFLQLKGVADGWQVSESKGGGPRPVTGDGGRQDRRTREPGSGTLYTAPLGQKEILRAGSKILATRGR